MQRRVPDSLWDLCVRTASEFPIREYCDRAGIGLVRCGRGWRHAEYDSLKIDGNKWKRWSGRTDALGKYTQGCTIQFVQELSGMDFREAVTQIVAVADPALAKSVSAEPRESVDSRLRRLTGARRGPARENPSRPFRLPRKNRCAQQVYDYLTQVRGLDGPIIERELKAGRLYQDLRQNCVFVGFDETGRPAFACMRSTSEDSVLKMDQAGSRKACSWRVMPEGAVSRLLVFESPIEALSYMSILKKEGRDYARSAYLSLGGVAGPALFHCLEHVPGTVPEIVLCLNNDKAGRSGAMQLARAVKGRASVRLVVPSAEGSDWNDALRAGKHTCRSLAAQSRRSRLEELNR